MTAQVFLIPGFFGFTNLGDFAYFSHVREVLGAKLDRLGVRATIVPIDTLPTSSIRKRSLHLVERVKRTVAEGDTVHLVGHSTGGLDARLLISEGFEVPGKHDVLPSVRSVVTLATPHRGTPIAAFFTGLLGQRLLRLLSISTVAAIRLGSIPAPALLFLGGAIGATGALRFASGGVLDQVYQLVLRDFSDERQKQLETFFDQAQKDQTLLLQLTPEAMDLVHSLARPAEHVACGSVVAVAPKPSLSKQRSFGLNPSLQAMYNLFRGLHLLTSAVPDHFDYEPTVEQRRALVQFLGKMPDRRDNDGMVPALSQVFGDVIYAVSADHMDVMGHFHAPEHHPRHVDWLRTGSGFRAHEFEEMLTRVANHIREANQS